MLARTQRDRNSARHADRKYVFGVVRYAGRVAMAPGRINLVNVRQAPVVQADVHAVGNDAVSAV